MGDRPIPGVLRRVSGAAASILLLLFSLTAGGQERTGAPVADVFQVMELAADGRMNTLWPAFETSDIPILVFDGIDTYLFHFRTIPEGFARSLRDPEVLIYHGQHPQARGNSIIRLGETLVATSVLSSSSKRTGERYALKDMAGIIVHEQFHVFQRTRHPQWRQNDGLLLRYPAETAESLLQRRMEKEAFKRAVVAEERAEIAGWARLALRCREGRLAGLEPPFVLYEKELQRTEGLSDYVERVSRGLDPLNASEMTKGIAPAGVRDLGYVEGRWTAMILDKLYPGWKALLEGDDRLYLEEILRTALKESPGQTNAFRPEEAEKMDEAARSDFAEWQRRKKDEIKAYAHEPGFHIEIDASNAPLVLRLFEPLEMEILDDGGVYHRFVFAAGHEGGSLRIMDHPCLTWFNDSFRVIRLSVNGLKQAPEIIDGEKKLVVKEDGLTIELKYARVSLDNNLYRCIL